jgi:hypothetical protein
MFLNNQITYKTNGKSVNIAGFALLFANNNKDIRIWIRSERPHAS